MNVNQTVRIIPTLKVNNRNINEVFYVKTLGMKPLLEESAFLSLGDQSGLEKLVLEESPSMRTRKVQGTKKLAKLIVKVKNPSEIEALLARMETLPKLFKGKKGYAFEIFSPQDHLILLHAEDDINELKELDEEVNFSKNDSMIYLSEFEISTEVHLPSQIKSLVEDVETDKKLIFKQGHGEDLLVENSLTWDLSMLKFQVEKFDIPSLCQKFESVGYFVPKSEKFFLTTDTNNIELWFEEV